MIFLVNDDKASKYFDSAVTERDRAIFEGGITLGAIYHQISGFPLPKNSEGIKKLEKLIEDSFKNQPFIESININIKAAEHDQSNPYSYDELSGRNLSINLVSKYKNVKVHFKMDHLKELNYPLMRIIKIEE